MNEVRNLPAVSDEKLNIVCPACGADNVIARGDAFTCAKCLKPLTGNGLYSRIKKFGAGKAMILGGAVVYSAMSHFSADRYPVLTEHAIMETCISGTRQPMPREFFFKKRKACACALTGTQGKFDSGDYEEKRDEFRQAFNERLWACVKGTD